MEFRSKLLKNENQYIKTSMNINAALPVLKRYALFKHFLFAFNGLRTAAYYQSGISKVNPAQTSFHLSDNPAG